MGMVTPACTFWESCQGRVRQLVTPNTGSHKHREGSSCVPAGSLGEWGAHDLGPVIDIPTPGTHVPGAKKDAGP